jgi:hypothetical protein
VSGRETDWKVGDILAYRHDPNLQREIVDVRPTGYGWKYPEYGNVTPAGGENYWWSENSTDPSLCEWNKVSSSAPMPARVGTAATRAVGELKMADEIETLKLENERLRKVIDRVRSGLRKATRADQVKAFLDTQSIDVAEGDTEDYYRARQVAMYILDTVDPLFSGVVTPADSAPN